LFGSAARGDVHQGSDLDLIVVADTDLPFFDRIGQVLALHRSTRGLDVLVYTPEEFDSMRRQGRRFILDALRGGRALYSAPRCKRIRQHRAGTPAPRR
jgi:predicted nucleotidyltransferase